MDHRNLQEAVITTENARHVRLAARLDVKGPSLIKGIQFEGLRILGSPKNFAKSYYAQGVDELIYIDHVASLYDRSPSGELLSEVLREVFIPVTVGGGIRSVEDARGLLRAGADKVALNTAATRNPRLITELAETFGSQCIVASIEAKQRGPGSWEALFEAGRQSTGLDVVEWAEEVVSRGAGEILLTSIDKDGLERGFDLDLIREVGRVSQVPLVASGGMGKYEDAYEILRETTADALAVGSAAHYGRITFDGLRRGLIREAFAVRPFE